MNARLVTDALTMALWQRQPKPGLIVHSDRGSQYASNAYRRLLYANGFVGSMSRKGDCWDTRSPRVFCELKKGTCAVAKLPDAHGVTAGHSELRCDVL
jgi:hypothetical protein